VEEAPLPPYPSATADAPILVAGSTWPPDEALLREALRSVWPQIPALRLVIAPHEPTEAHLAGLERAWADAGPCRLSQWEQNGAAGSSPERPSPAAAPPRVLLVDRVGRLAGLYRLGTLAFVGGAFTSGVHNVAEPAAAGLPVLFGPRFQNSAAAKALLGAGLAQAVTDAKSLDAALLGLLKTPQRCVSLGRQARAQIESMASAAQTCWQALVGCVPALQPPR